MEISIRHYIKPPDSDDFESYQITECVDSDGFPDSLQSEIKGDGYFDFKVSPFIFKVIKEKYALIHADSARPVAECTEVDAMLNIKRHDPVELYDELTGEILMRGFVDRVEGWITSTPKVTVFPDFLRWKDVQVGIEKTDDEGDDPWYEFKEIDNIKIIVDKMAQYVNDRSENVMKPHTTTQETIPETDPPTGASYLASKLHIRAEEGLSFNIAKMFINAFDGSFFRRKGSSPYQWFYEIKDAGIFKRILINKGQWLSIDDAQWLNWTLYYPSGITLTSVGFSLPSISFSYPCGLTWFALKWCTANWLGNHISLGNIMPSVSWSSFSFDVPNGSINVPSGDVKIPCIGSQHDLYECESGDMEYVEGYTKSIFPIIDGNYHLKSDEDQTISSLNTEYGARYDGFSSGVSEAKMKKFAEDENVEFGEIRAGFAKDEFNSYSIIQIKRKAWAYEDWLLSWEIPFDFTQRYHFKNASAMDVLKNLAVLTNRTIFATYTTDHTYIHLEPRTSVNTKTIPIKYILTRETDMKRDQDVDIKIDRVKKDTDGKITDFGFYIREAEFDYLQKYYKDLWNGNLINNTLELLNAKDNDLEGEFTDPSLFDTVILNDNGTEINMGTCIKLNQGTEKSSNRIVCQYYHNQEGGD